jgi:hypothetical protein
MVDKVKDEKIGGGRVWIETSSKVRCALEHGQHFLGRGIVLKLEIISNGSRWLETSQTTNDGLNSCRHQPFY